jgi:ABC-type transport system involved in cytochrome c biogenesis permease subunit
MHMISNMQVLLPIFIKGYKNQYAPLMNLYRDLFYFSELLISLLEVSVDQVKTNEKI